MRRHFWWLLLLLVLSAPTALATDSTDPTEPIPTETVPGETTPAEPAQEGLVTVDGKLYYYEDGVPYTGGYKAVERDGKRTYYYFQADGTAFTGGYLHFTVGEKPYYFYFQDDGTAFTGGYKEIDLDGKTHYFYFLANGQGYNTGYKTVMIDGKKHYFYFGADGRAVTDKLETIPLGERTAYMLFGSDGKAYTAGYKALGEDHYYFLGNGQAFTTGYKTVKLDGTTYFYYFQPDGKAFTGGVKEVPFGAASYTYCFGTDGRAVTDSWQTLEGKSCYFQPNGRLAKDAFVTLEDKLYYFDPNCDITTGGWFCVGDGYYFADDKGELSTDSVIEGYRLDSAGKCATKYRVRQLVAEHTTADMTDQQKIEALYDWLLKNSMVYIRTYEHTKSTWVWKDSWVDDMAASMLDKWGGNCYRYNSLLGLLIREATGLQVQVHHGKTRSTSGGLTYHGWATVLQDGTWYIYDVELQKHAKVARSRCYQVPAETSGLHQQGVGTNLY